MNVHIQERTLWRGAGVLCLKRNVISSKEIQLADMQRCKQSSVYACVGGGVYLLLRFNNTLGQYA